MNANQHAKPLLIEALVDFLSPSKARSLAFSNHSDLSCSAISHNPNSRKVRIGPCFIKTVSKHGTSRTADASPCASLVAASSARDVAHVVLLTSLRQLHELTNVFML